MPDDAEPKTIDLMKVLTDSLARREDAAGRVEAIAARLNAATPGPWQRDRNWYVTAEGHDWDKCWLSAGVTLDNYEPQHDRRICHVHGPETRGHDAAADFDFIAHSRSDMEYLLAALSTAERDAKRWRFARTILHVVSTGPSGGYYLTSDVADGMDVQAVSPDGFVDQFAAARVPSGGET